MKGGSRRAYEVEKCLQGDGFDKLVEVGWSRLCSSWWTRVGPSRRRTRTATAPFICLARRRALPPCAAPSGTREHLPTRRVALAGLLPGYDAQNEAPTSFTGLAHRGRRACCAPF